MMAGDPGAMKLEQDFVGALSRTRAFDRAQAQNGVLSLRDGAGAETLRFTSAAK
jgi:heat shock protein HslJ